MVEMNRDEIILTNKSALEIRNAINAYVMVCEYNSREGYRPAAIIKRNKNRCISFDFFLGIKACDGMMDAKIFIKLAAMNNEKDGKYLTYTICQYSVKELSEYAPEAYEAYGKKMLHGDPYKFRARLALNIQDMEIEDCGRYVAFVDTKTATGKNILLDACYFEVEQI